MDKIIIKDLRLYAYHGVNEEEKINGQFFLLSLECRVDLFEACMNDSVDSTVSYAKIIKTAAKAFRSQKFNLIERAAQCVADAVLDEYPAVEQVTVLLKKPDAPVKADIAYAAVEITRKRNC